MSKSNLQFGGEEYFDIEPARVFSLAVDLDAMARIIPNLVSSERPDKDTLTCVVRPGFSFLRGTLNLTIRLVDLVEPLSATTRIEAKGIGVKMEVQNDLKIVAEGAGSKLIWQARVTKLSGLVATVSTALIQAASQQVIQHAWQRFREEIESNK